MSAALDIGSYDRDEDLLQVVRAGQGGALRVYPVVDVQVVLGRGSRPELELDQQACIDDGVAVLRRRGGGCAVLLDPGNLVVAVALAAEGYGDNQRYLRGLSGWLIAGLAACGVGGVSRAGICDLTWRGRKIAGACLYRSRGLLFYCATLLVEPHVELMTRYLKHPPREPDYRRGRSHAEFVGALAPVIGAGALCAGLSHALRLPAAKDFG